MNEQLSPQMQMQCHRVAQKACDAIFQLLFEKYRINDEPEQHNKESKIQKDSP